MDNSLVPVEQKTVTFYEDELTAVVVEVDDRRQVFVPLRPICDYLGLSWSGQFERLGRDLILSELVLSVRVTRTDIDPAGKQPHASDMVALPLDYLNGWLFGINARRVKDAVRPSLLRYQKECYRILYEATQEGRLSVEDDFETYLAQADPAVVDAYKVATAVVKIARQQVIFDAELRQAHSKLSAHEQRLERLEERLDTAENVTDEEASQISQAVKAIALASPEKNFGAVYGELYRREGVTSYKNIKRTRYKAVLEWLTEWYQALTSSDDIPF